MVTESARSRRYGSRWHGATRPEARPSDVAAGPHAGIGRTAATSGDAMRILFASTQGGGHVGPLLPFARSALAAGHTVLLAAPIPRSELPLATLDTPPFRAAAWAPVFTPQSPGLVHTLQELFIGLDAATALPGMLTTVERFA